MRCDIYDKITNHIISDLEKGERPWHRPWTDYNTSGRISQPLRANGVPYRGINVLMLWDAASRAGYHAATWMTYNQALELGGQVRKGERCSLVVYANKVTRTHTDIETGEEEERQIPYLKGYCVFNADQVDGLPTKFHNVPAPLLDPVERDCRADAFFAATGANIQNGGNSAYYNVLDDRVQMPPFAAFHDAQSYYATLAHEMTHWTKHPERLDRDLGKKRWGDEGYAMEELVAELGAAFLCADLQLSPEPRKEHAAYLAGWLRVLKKDKRAIIYAASYAQRAVDFLSHSTVVSKGGN